MAIVAHTQQHQIERWRFVAKEVAQLLFVQVGGLVRLGEPFAVAIGFAIALAEIAIGLGALSGLAFRLAAFGGAGLPGGYGAGPGAGDGGMDVREKIALTRRIQGSSKLKQLAALGIPTFVLVPYTPDWRWLRGRDDTPWYPTLRLFRQPKPREWDSVFDRVQSAVQSLL